MSRKSNNKFDKKKKVRVKSKLSVQANAVLPIGSKRRGRPRKPLLTRPEIRIVRIGVIGDGISELNLNVDGLNAMFPEIHFADDTQRPPNWSLEQKRKVMRYILSGESVLEPLCMTDVHAALGYSRQMLDHYKQERNAAMIAWWQHSVDKYNEIKVGYRTINISDSPERQYLNKDKRGRQYNSINGGHRSRVHREYKDGKDIDGKDVRWTCLPFTYPWPVLVPLTDDDKDLYEIPELNVRFISGINEIDYPALSWDELPKGIQDEYKKSLYRVIVLKKVHYEEQHDMFEMLNSGEPPTKQTIRNNTPARLYKDTTGIYKVSGGLAEYIRQLTNRVYGTRRTLFDTFMTKDSFSAQADQELTAVFLQIFCDIMDGKPYGPDVSVNGLDSLYKWSEEEWNFDKAAFEEVLEELERVVVRRDMTTNGKRLFPFYEFDEIKQQAGIENGRNSGGDKGWVVSLFCFLTLKKYHGHGAVATTKELDFLNLWEAHEEEKRHIDPLLTTSYNYQCLTTSRQYLLVRMPVQEALVLSMCKSWQKNRILRDTIRFFSDGPAGAAAKRQSIPQSDICKYERDHNLNDGSLNGWLEGVQSDSDSCVLLTKLEHANRSREQARWRASDKYYKEEIV